MFTENGLLIDIDEVGKVVSTCDVFTIGFGMFPQRVIVDTREADDVGPLVQVVEPVTSVEERFHWLGRERPSFGVPEQFSFFVWPHSLEFLQSCGLWSRLSERLGAEGRPRVREMMDGTLTDLRGLERSTVQRALSGDGFHSLWPQE